MQRLLPYFATLADSFSAQKQAVIAGVSTYLYLKVTSVFAVVVPVDSSAAVEFVAAMIEYIMELLSAVSVALITITASHYYKKYLIQKDAIKDEPENY